MNDKTESRRAVCALHFAKASTHLLFVLTFKACLYRGLIDDVRFAKHRKCFLLEKVVMQGSTKRSFWNFGIGGLVGAAIAGFGTFFAQQQVSLSENQYFMELDKLRLAIMVEDTEDFEEQLKELRALREVRDKGYRPVFEQTLANDIAEIEGRISRVAQAKADAAAADAATAEAEARRKEAQAAAAAAQARKEQTLRTNPSFFLDCGGSTGRYCP